MPCDRGTYRTKGVQIFCTGCPSGFTTASNGSTTVGDCSVGESECFDSIENMFNYNPSWPTVNCIMYNVVDCQTNVCLEIYNSFAIIP